MVRFGAQRYSMVRRVDEIYVILEKDGHAFNNILENSEVFFVIEKNDPMAFIQGEGVAEVLGRASDLEERSIVTRKNLQIVPFLRMNPDTYLVKIKMKRIWVSYFYEGWMPRIEIVIDDNFSKMLADELTKTSKIPLIIQSTRPWSLPATIAAVIFGTLISPTIDFLKFSLTFIGAILVHLGVNAFSDYFDYKKGADKWYTLGSSRVLVEGLLKPKEVLFVGIVLILLSLIVGLLIVYLTNFNRVLIYLILIGGVLGIFYAFIPIGWKYVGMGDLAVFLAWTGIAFGSYFVQTLTMNTNIILASLPLSLLIVAILHGNNMRDIDDDKRAGYFTLASLLGKNLSKYYYLLLILSAYVIFVLNVVLGILPVWALVALLSIPVAYRNVLWAFRDNYVQKGMLDLYTANLVSQFSILLIVGMVIGRIL
jgi:1,4-dihydroxy-2-naphthoate octaprenyltransferase